MNLNYELFLKINAKTGQNRWLDAFARAGAEWVVLGMAGWYVAISLILNFGKEFAMYLPIMTFFVCGCVGLLVSNATGFFVQEVRPRLRFPEIRILFSPMSSWKSFPSDHTFGAFLIFFLALIFNFPTAWGLLPLAVWVGWGRIFSGVHFPLDVVGGVFLAGLMSIVSYFVLSFIHLI
ncbi:MAG: phosphatase PAP2 family protein [Candidatus Magasanikbacteria bacterium]